MEDLSKRIIVHLGNVGIGRDKKDIPAEKTERYARRFSDFAFYGIDHEKYGASNFTQFRNNYLAGLGRFPDDSIDIISSDMAVGYYESLGAVEEILSLSRKKLKGGGKFLLSIGALAQIKGEMIKGALEKLNFEDVIQREFEEMEYLRTYWTRVLGRHGETIYQLKATKGKVMKLSCPIMRLANFLSRK